MSCTGRVGWGWGSMWFNHWLPRAILGILHAGSTPAFLTWTHSILITDWWGLHIQIPHKKSFYKFKYQHSKLKVNGFCIDWQVMLRLPQGQHDLPGNAKTTDTGLYISSVWNDLKDSESLFILSLTPLTFTRIGLNENKDLLLKFFIKKYVIQVPASASQPYQSLGSYGSEMAQKTE